MLFVKLCTLLLLRVFEHLYQQSLVLSQEDQQIVQLLVGQKLFVLVHQQDWPSGRK
uniref:Uncharacterized protein n=1 Tax=uncultured marine virus TaxID=186617 RepID=A0A0F7L399_9VIRU|nr:hypothetical protein [uncultured marine virus]